MLRLAFRNLLQSKARLMISIGGVALALMLILSLDAIFAGSQNQVTAYIDHSRADIFVAQSGVRNMHMAASALPMSVASEVKVVPGVESATPILYLTNMIVVGDERNLAYVIGLPTRPVAGGPWRIVEGKSIPSVGEAVIDRGVAVKSGVWLGDEVEILGEDFTVVGLSEGTATLLNSVAFISKQDFARLRGEARTVSFVLVKVTPGESPERVAARIEANVNDVTALPRAEFAEQERRVVRDMGNDIIAIMNLVGFLIGLAVMALTVYTATLARRAEYGVLKALGARDGHLYNAVLTQAFISVALGFALGFAFTELLSLAVPYLNLNLALAISNDSLLKVGMVSLIIAGASAILPIRQIAGLDPAMVFRGK
jgi:putative ABC transport system permease protein